MIVEGKYMASKPRNRLRHRWNRFWRKNSHDFAKSDQPFSWEAGISGRPMYNVKDQGQSDSCGGQAGSRAIQILLNSPELSAKSLYSQCFSQGGGVWYPDLSETLLYKGLTTEANVPSYPNTEANLEDTSWKTPAMMKDCLTRAGYTLLNVDINPDAIANAINAYMAVIFIVNGVNNQTWLSSTPTPPDSNVPQSKKWEHFLCFAGNIPPQTSNYYIPFYNSWGTSCGANGIQYLSTDYINSGNVVDCFAVLPFSFTSDLSFGSMGSEVCMLQEMLRSLGYFTFPYNSGFFGLLTQSAVSAYQKANGITPTAGFFGNITMASLNQMLINLRQIGK